MAEEPNQDNEWDGHAQQQEQNGTHVFIAALVKTHVSSHHDTIAFLTADRGGNTRAKSAD
jgi:hypothetical protein